MTDINTPIHLKDILFPCVYFLHYKGAIVYVGSTENHYKIIGSKTEGMVIFDSFSYIRYETIEEAKEAEKIFTLKIIPKYNTTKVVKYKKLDNNSLIINRPLNKVDICIDGSTFHIPFVSTNGSFSFENSMIKGYFKEDVIGNYKGGLIYNRLRYWFHGRDGNSSLTIDAKSIPQRKGIVSRKTRDNSYTYTPQKPVS